MLKNYLLIAIRTLLKHKVFTAVNITGLAFGMLCAFFLALWVWDEISVDKFHLNGESIYKVLGETDNDGQTLVRPYAPSSIAEPLQTSFPEIENAARTFPAEVVFSVGTSKFKESGIYADPSFLEIFSFELIEGSLSLAFPNPQSVIISEGLANKYFPGESALGKPLEIIEQRASPYVVSAVLKEIPASSSIQFDFILAYDEFEKKHRPWWGKDNKASFNNFNINLYLTLIEDADVNALNDKLFSFITNYTEEPSRNSLFLYPFQEYYLHADFSHGRIPTGRIEQVRLLSIIAVLVFAIAGINFINMSTAIAGKRAKEISLRKVAGARKQQLVGQFLLESVLISMVATTIAITLVEITLPIFNALTQKSILLPFSSPTFLLLLSCTGIVMGIVAGAYPAFVLSSFDPAQSLKGKSAGVSKVWLRKGLVVVQFSLSVMFISFAVVISDQLNFLQNKDLGIRKENIIQHSLNSIRGSKEAYKQELLKIPAVQSVTFTEQNPLGLANDNLGVFWEGMPNNANVFFNVIQTGADFVKTFELDLVDGRSFRPNLQAAEAQFLLNEAAIAAMGIDDPIGTPLTVWGREGKVVGVVRDYNHQSLVAKIEPVVAIYNPEETWSAFISLSGEQTSKTLAAIKEVYEQFERDYLFEYSFVEEDYKSNYGDEATVAYLSQAFALVAVVISCLGLFGLSAFMAEQKTKETGVRKVLGAGLPGLIYLFSGEFLKLVLGAITLATPLAWVYANQWLSNYSYRIELSLTPFIIAALLALAISLATVLYNTLRAALADPVQTLRQD